LTFHPQPPLQHPLPRAAAIETKTKHKQKDEKNDFLKKKIRRRRRKEKWDVRIFTMGTPKL
jgi:hypothetical protein